MKNLFGIFDLTKGSFTESSEACYTFQADTISVTVFGRALADGINNGEKLIRIFREKRSRFTEHVTGVYIAVFYDAEQKTLMAFHDRSTSPAVLYYTQNGNSVYVGTSLKRLFAESGINRTLNENAVEDFVTNGYIYGDETLIGGVYKLKAFHCLSVSANGAKQLPVKYPVEEMSKGQALDDFAPALERAIEDCFEGEEEINMPLSSGFDSNYIAFTAGKKGAAPINAFSVGGKFGKNELPAVTENAKHYDRLTLSSALTDENTLQNLPDIVWRLEGSVYEVGLFLQYELAKLVSDSGKKYLICGECADQVMNVHYLQNDRIFSQKKDGKPLYYEFSEYPFIFGNYLILKKNGILANSFGIETRYPYLDEKIVAISHALREINGKDKRVHTANCREKLPPEIIANMAKIGGATECHSLFGSKVEIKEFFAKIESSDFYRAHEAVIKRHSFAEKQKQTGVAKFKTRVRDILMKLLRVKKNDDYFNEEMKLREYMCIAYLLIFEKLFITGQADFARNGINTKLTDLL